MLEGKCLSTVIRCQSVHTAPERQLDTLESNWIFVLEVVFYRWNSASWSLGNFITQIKMQLNISVFRINSSMCWHRRIEPLLTEGTSSFQPDALSR